MSMRFKKLFKEDEMHPTYHAIRQELEEEEWRKSPFYNHERDRYLKSRNFSFVQLFESKFITNILSASMLILTIGVISTSVFLKPNPTVIPPTEFVERPLVDLKQASSGSSEDDLKLIKHILQELVPTVENLVIDREAKVVKNSGFEESTDTIGSVRVISDKANLRQSPFNAAPTLSVVSRDTVLLGNSESNGWIQITTPKGGVGWIHSSLVRKEER